VINLCFELSDHGCQWVAEVVLQPRNEPDSGTVGFAPVSFSPREVPEPTIRWSFDDYLQLDKKAVERVFLVRWEKS
jgi:hypothetical protein